jgi:hypothetical protein
MRIFIPTIGTHLKLTSDWKFLLHREYRNNDLWEALGLPVPKTVDWRYSNSNVTEEVILPKGTVLCVDRIYIRKNAEDFDSISFTIKEHNLQLQPNVRIEREPVAVPLEVMSPNQIPVVGYSKEWQERRDKIDQAWKEAYAKAKITKKEVNKKIHRFWAKLSDVNTMEVELATESNNLPKKRYFGILQEYSWSDPWTGPTWSDPKFFGSKHMSMKFTTTSSSKISNVISRLKSKSISPGLFVHRYVVFETVDLETCRKIEKEIYPYMGRKNTSYDEGRTELLNRNVTIIEEK